MKFISGLSRHVHITFYSWMAKIVGSLLQFMNIKLLLHYLDITSYSILAIVFSLQSYFLIMDLSVGFVFQNYISKKNTYLKNDFSIVGSSVFYAVIFSVLLFGTVIVFCSDMIINFLFSSYEIEKGQLKILFYAVCFVFSVGTIGNLSNKILYAIHQGHIPNILLAIASFCTTVILVALNYFHVLLGNYQLAGVFIAFCIPNSFLLIFVLIVLYQKYGFSIKKIKLKIMKVFYWKALPFWYIGLLALFVLQIDYLILAKTANPSEIASYNILVKIYSVFYILFNTALLTLWPRLSELYYQQDDVSIKYYLKRYIVYGIVFFIGTSVFLVYFMDIILNVLTNGKVLISYKTVLLYGFYQIIAVWVGVFAIFLQSINDTKFIAFWTFIQAIITLPLEYILSSSFGINGLIIALIVSFLLTGACALPLRTQFKLKRIFSNVH